MGNVVYKCYFSLLFSLLQYDNFLSIYRVPLLVSYNSLGFVCKKQKAKEDAHFDILGKTRFKVLLYLFPFIWHLVWLLLH